MTGIIIQRNGEDVFMARTQQEGWGVPQTRVGRIQEIEETLVPLQDMFL